MEIPSQEIRAVLFDGTETKVKVLNSIPFRKAQQIKNEVLGPIKVKGGDAEAPASVFFELESKVTEELWAKNNPDLDHVDFNKSPELAELIQQKLAEFQNGIRQLRN